MIKSFSSLSVALFLAHASLPQLMAQTLAQYKIEIEAEAASGSWKLGIGTDAALGVLVWADFNGNGKKDDGEGWSAARADKMGVCNFSQKRTSDKLTVYGPVTTLFCGGNGVVTLKTSANRELRNLAANNNSISLIDLTGNIKLERVNLEDNQLARLTVTGLSALVDLRLNGNSKISSLNLQGVKALQRLDISETKISKITNADFSTLKGINLSAASNFDFSVLQNAALLEELGLTGSKVTTIDLTRHPRLKTLWAPNCEFESLDFSGNPDLSQVMLNHNKLNGADFSNNMRLRNVYLENNGLQHLRLPGEGSRVRVLNIAGVKTLTSLDLSHQTELWVLQLDGSGVTSLDLSSNPSLGELTMSETAISELDLRDTPNLQTLNVAGCKELKKLDLTNSQQLNVLYCGKSGLNELDLRACENLTEFTGEQNSFKELVFNSKSLNRVECSGNMIEGEAMTKLVNSLPRVSSGRFVVVDLSVSGSENKCTPAQVKIAKDKGWQVLDRNIGGSEYRPYPGAESTALDELADTSVKVYPTVASRAINVEGAAGSKYYIYMMSGALVSRGELGDGLGTIPIAGLTPGSYVLRLSSVLEAFKVQVVVD